MKKLLMLSILVLALGACGSDAGKEAEPKAVASTENQETNGMTEEKVLKSGAWTAVKGGFDADGKWEIVEKDGKKFFKTEGFKNHEKGPDLHLVFTKADFNALSEQYNDMGTHGKDYKDVKGEIGTKKDELMQASTWVKVEELLPKSKDFEYELPANFDMSQFKTVLIHCVQEQHLFSGSSL